MDNSYNCKTCLYANDFGNGLVMCDRRVLLDGKEVIIEEDKVGLSCPCHSDRFVEETRYMVNPPNRDARKSFDSCEVCGRRYDEMNKDNYDVVTEEVKINSTVEKRTVRKCRICIEKERNLFE